MGYTSYWYQKPVLDQKSFDEFSEVVSHLLSTNEAKELLAYEYDNISTPPSITNQEVRFNGKGDDGHETFLFKRETEMRDYKEDEKMCFEFCKTAQKPYDKYVVACLLIAKLIFQKSIKISSDGDIEDWQEGKKLAEQVLNSTIKISQNKNGEFQVSQTKQVTTEEDFIKDITK